MDFIGTGRRLAQGDVGEAARAIGIETAVLLAFLEVEAAGRGFDTRNRPKMLFEPHVLYRNTSGATRKRAVSEGLAYKRWGTKPYPADSYPRLARAIEIAREPAFRSGSYGLPQILGENHAAAGFISAEAMFVAMKRGERDQLDAMVTLLKSWGLAKHLRGKDFSKPKSWVPAVRRYNGSAFATHGYHKRCAAAYVKHRSDDPMQVPASSSEVLAKGMKGEAVRNLQSDLAALGYVFDLGIDGRFGAETDSHVRAFQKTNDLIVDGRVGPKTRAAIERVLESIAKDHSPEPPVWSGQNVGIAAALIGLVIGAFLFLKAKFKRNA